MNMKSVVMHCFGVCLVLAVSISVTHGDNDKDVVIEFTESKECERRSKVGDKISMDYTGKLENGKQFDSSIGKKPLDFELGAGRVIKGWDESLSDMCVGDKRTLTIPPHKAYGKSGAGSLIPPDSTLIFDVELVKIHGVENEKTDPVPDADAHDEADSGEGKLPDDDVPEIDEAQDEEGFFVMMDKNKDDAISKEELAEYIRQGAPGPEGEGQPDLSEGSPDGAPEGGPDDLPEGDGSPEGSTDTMIEEIFAQEDKNKDGKITREEFMKHDDEL